MTFIDALPWYILLALNGITFLLYGYDKLASKTGKVSLRISEKTLLFFAFFGGVGAFFAMLLFRHKTRHKKFTLFVPLLFVFQLIVLTVLIVTGVLITPFT